MKNFFFKFQVYLSFVFQLTSLPLESKLNIILLFANNVRPLQHERKSPCAVLLLLSVPFTYSINGRLRWTIEALL